MAGGQLSIGSMCQPKSVVIVSFEPGVRGQRRTRVPAGKVPVAIRQAGVRLERAIRVHRGRQLEAHMRRDCERRAHAGAVVADVLHAELDGPTASVRHGNRRGTAPA